MNKTTNSMQDTSVLPRYEDITPQAVTPVLAGLLAHCKTVMRQTEQDSAACSWDNVIVPLENATESLGHAWVLVGHLHSVCDTPELRAVYNENQPLMTEFFTSLGQNLVLYKKYLTLQASAEFATYSPARKKIIQNAVRDFKLSGAELPERHWGRRCCVSDL